MWVKLLRLELSLGLTRVQIAYDLTPLTPLAPGEHRETVLLIPRLKYPDPGDGKRSRFERIWLPLT